MSGLLTGGQIALARRIAEANLHSSCEIILPVEDASDAGQSWPSGSAVTVKCMKGNPGRGGELEIGYDGDAPVSRFWVPVGTQIAPGAQITFAGRNYDVQTIPSIHASELLQPVDCVETRIPGAVV